MATELTDFIVSRREVTGNSSVAFFEIREKVKAGEKKLPFSLGTQT